MFEFLTETYRLTFPPDRPFVYLDTPDGKRLAELFILSSVHAAHGRDDTIRVYEWQKTETPTETIFSLQADSSIWRAKTYRLRCTPTRLTYEIEVEGGGQLTEVHYFGGYASHFPRWGAGFFRSGQHFEQGFTPEPNSTEEIYFPASANSVIDLMGVPLPGKDNWFFTPPPFCFAFQHPGGWIAFGVEAAPGANRFTEYTYHGTGHAFHLSLSYEGYTTVSDTYKLPAIGFDFAPDEYSALAAHVESLCRLGAVPASNTTDKPYWWKSPIFCGWGAQCYEASREQGRAPDYSRQALYEKFLETLEQKGILPGIVVLDDKWQATYGENYADKYKWPDLSGFITCQHAAGRKVLLWLKAWDAEGLPPDECITNQAGVQLAFDPTNPKFEQRLRTSIRQMLSPLGYDADGFKLDFTARIPAAPNLCLYENTWGLELMKRYLSILTSEAKAVKPEALIMTHTPHPYLSDSLDMIRLNDINLGHDTNRAMTHRASVAAIACPHALIDTDNWPVTDKATWRKYLQLQPELGSPSLYYATHIDSTGEALDDEDYQLIRDAWQRYQVAFPA